VQRSMTNGPRGWPAGPTLQPLVGRIHGDTLQKAVTGNPKPKGGNRESEAKSRWRLEPMATRLCG
jgi:hypothetical protein